MVGRAALRTMIGPAQGGMSRGLDEDRWFAVHTLQHREFGAAKQLEFQGYRVFLPLHQKTVRHARKFRTTKAPFFPRYLFVQMSLARHQWRSVNGTFGVSRLVMANDLPMPVPSGIVEALDAITDETGVLSFSSRLRPGQKVRILSGPFAQQIGELRHADDKNRVQILLHLMGAQLMVRATTEILAPVS